MDEVTATVTRTNETFGPHRRYTTGQVVSGPEADRLVNLGLAEYDVEDQPADSEDEATNPEEKES